MDLTRNELKSLRKLSTKKGRREAGKFPVEGVRCIKELLSSDYACKMLIVCRNLLSETGHDFLDSLRGVPVYELNTRQFNQIANEKSSQGLIAVTDAKKFDTIEFEAGELLVVIQKMSDPSNLGSIIRSAVAFGAGLIIGSESAELYSPKVISASSGYLFKAKIKQVEAIPGELNSLREHSIAVWGADNTGEDIGKIKEMPSRIALVIGHEAFGLADDVARKLDKIVRIPISANVDSLSAPVAGSILLQRISERMGILK
ncbi:MAG: hypothetical protein GF310_11775 [candidate division Zixibacteria bacterium]|nr:hypothetical protein [candidate division Zixibacteria bacterium]